MHVDGVVTGDIIASRITIGAGATITGSLKAESVVISGTVHGLIRGGAVSLTRTARVFADITHSQLAIDAGAFFDGNCRPAAAESPAYGSPASPEILGVATTAGQPAITGSTVVTAEFEAVGE